MVMDGMKERADQLDTFLKYPKIGTKESYVDSAPTIDPRYFGIYHARTLFRLIKFDCGRIQL